MLLYIKNICQNVLNIFSSIFVLQKICWTEVFLFYFKLTWMLLDIPDLSADMFTCQVCQLFRFLLNPGYYHQVELT